MLVSRIHRLWQSGFPTTARQLRTKSCCDYSVHSCTCTFCSLVLGSPLDALLCLSKEVGHHVSNEFLLIVGQFTKIMDRLDALLAQGQGAGEHLVGEEAGLGELVSLLQVLLYQATSDDKADPASLQLTPVKMHATS